MYQPHGSSAIFSHTSPCCASNRIELFLPILAIGTLYTFCTFEKHRQCRVAIWKALSQAAEA